MPRLTADGKGNITDGKLTQNAPANAPQAWIIGRSVRTPVRRKVVLNSAPQDGVRAFWSYNLCELSGFAASNSNNFNS
jgi:hypothetical protein